MTMLSKKNPIETLVVKYPYHRGYWKFHKDGMGQLHIFLKEPVFLTNHYLLIFEICVLWRLTFVEYL